MIESSLKRKQDEESSAYVRRSTSGDSVDAAPVAREEKLSRGLAGRHQQMSELARLRHTLALFDPLYQLQLEVSLGRDISLEQGL